MSQIIINELLKLTEALKIAQEVELKKALDEDRLANIIPYNVECDNALTVKIVELKTNNEIKKSEYIEERKAAIGISVKSKYEFNINYIKDLLKKNGFEGEIL